MKRIVVVCLCVLATGCAARVDTADDLAHPVLSASLPAPTTRVEATLPSVSEPTAPTIPVSAKLSPHGKEVLAKARQDGVTSVVLVLSTETGAAEQVASAVRGLGATVEATDSSIGYVRVSVPPGDVERVAAVDGVRQVDVDEPLSRIDPTP
ncbi:hypothetical protein ACQPZF_36820 [Actinosynnema sp. CS-041913]|uniref:hypothetical protein n=1 Tax=Actinosynnema sp. CS-041913 TaxID=3239917 RepID=UPI003D8ECC2F